MILTLLLLIAPAEPTPQFSVENKMPAFSVENKVPAADPRGVWSPYWDGRQWQPRWVGGKVEVTPLSASPFPGSTPPTIAPSAAGSSIGNPGLARYPVATYTLVPQATRGGITTSNCPPSG